MALLASKVVTVFLHHSPRDVSSNGTSAPTTSSSLTSLPTGVPTNSLNFCEFQRCCISRHCTDLAMSHSVGVCGEVFVRPHHCARSMLLHVLFCMSLETRTTWFRPMSARLWIKKIIKGEADHFSAHALRTKTTRRNFIALKKSSKSGQVHLFDLLIKTKQRGTTK